MPYSQQYLFNAKLLTLTLTKTPVTVLTPMVTVASNPNGVNTLRTQDTIRPSDWCWSVRTVRHQWTLRHWYRTVLTSSKHFLCYNRPYRRKV